MEHNYHKNITSENTNRVLFREQEDNIHSPSILVNEANGQIGIEVGSHFVFMSIREWHELATEKSAPIEQAEEGKVEAPNWDKNDRNPRFQPPDAPPEYSEPKESKEIPKKSWWKIW